MVQFQTEFHGGFENKKILLPVNFQKSSLKGQNWSIFKLIKKKIIDEISTFIFVCENSIIH